MKPIIYSLFQHPLLMPYVVTEYGIVNLQGKSISERAMCSYSNLQSKISRILY